jgi:hypothetical protein
MMAKGELRKRQQHVIVEDERTPAVQRCGFTPSVGRVTCDRYEVDRVEVDGNVDIKKFYLFRAQFDVQLFSNLSFVENNGRGGGGLWGVQASESVSRASGAGLPHLFASPGQIGSVRHVGAFEIRPR